MAAALARDACPRFALTFLLGRQVAAAFGFPRAGRARAVERAGRFVMLPHPSGRCRFWNRPGREAEAAEFVRALLARYCPGRCCGGGCY